MEVTPPNEAEPRPASPTQGCSNEAPPVPAGTGLYHQSHATRPSTLLPNGDPCPDSTFSSPPSSSRTTDAPPFWLSRPGRSISSISYHSLQQDDRRVVISLEDHSGEHDLATQGCWARSVAISDYVIITGPTGVGAYVVWLCTVYTLTGNNLEIRKRYSEFDQLRADLLRSFPHAEAMVPDLPRKSIVSHFRPKFLERRRQGLLHFMNCILLNPEFAASPVLKDFIFA